MSSIRSLAAEFDAQPYEVRAFADLPLSVGETDTLDDDTETTIREAWAENLAWTEDRA